MNNNDVKLSQSEFTEILTALRLSVDRYQQHSEAALSRDSMQTAAEWAGYAENAQALYNKLADADQIIVRTFTE